MTQVQIYNNYTDIRKQNVCLATIKEARDTRQMRALAVYYFFKQHFSNSVLFNYRTRKAELAGVCGISARTLHTYISQWRAWGLTEGHKSNLLLISNRRVKKAYRERYKVQITRSNSDTIADIEARLYGKLLEQHNKRMNFKHQVLTAAEKTKKRATQSDTLIRRCDESLQDQPAFSLSLRNAAKELNLSLVKTTKIMRSLNSLDIIKTGTNPAKAVGQGVGLYRAIRGELGYFYMYGNTVYRRFGNRHKFLEHPAPNKPVSYKQLMHHLKNGSPELKKQLYAVMT